MSTLMSPTTAPRNLDELAKQGPFIHRRLGEQLEQAGFKCWENEREKTAFVTASPADRAQMLLVQLAAFDAANGGAPPAAAALQAPPPLQSPPPQIQAQVQAQPPAREPRTAPGPSNGVSAAPAQPPAAAQGSVLELLNTLRGIEALQTTMNGAIAKIGDLNVARAGAVESLIREVQDIKGALANFRLLQEVQLGLLYLFGQQVLQASGEDFLPVAVADAQKVLEILQALKGKG